jgi:hypothetical protein
MSSILHSLSGNATRPAHRSPSGSTPACDTQLAKRPQSGGFALVIALSLMAFVLLLLLSITTLTQVEIRTASLQKEKLQAQQNALLGLKLALGGLQKLSGSDQRITTSAEIFDTDASTDSIEGVTHPNWVGVWDSDPGLLHLNDRLDTTNAYYNYDARRDGSDNRFLGWLVSGNQNNITDRDAAITAKDEVLIFGADFDDTDPKQLANQVRVEKMPITTGNTTAGRYAYWVSDENTKARIDAYEPIIVTVPIAAIERSRFMINQRSAIEKVASQGDAFSSLSGNSDQDAINVFTSPSDLNFILSNTADLQTSLDQNALTLTSRSYSLLTDSYTSGLKTDLSTLLRQSSLSTALDAGIPAYTNSNGSHALAQYPADTGTNLAPDSATWEQLQSYATTTAEPSGNAITARKHSATEHGYYPTVTRYRLNIVPVLVKDGGSDILNYHIEPVVVLANPYNASLRLGNEMHVQLYFEKRDLAEDQGIRIGNSFVKWDPNVRYQSLGSGSGGTDLFENNDLITYTDSNGIEYVGFTFQLSDVTLAPGEVTTFGVANDGSTYTGSNRLEQGAYDTGTSHVILTHKDDTGTILRADPTWAAIDETLKSPQAALQINVDTGAIQQSVVNTTNPKTGGSIHVKLLPFKMAIGLSDQAEPTQLDDFYHLAQGFECSVPNSQMRNNSGQNQKYDRNRVLKVSSLYDYNAMTTRAVSFDIAMAGGFEYDDNDIRGATESCATGFRINNRWLIGHNFRAPHHAPIATDHIDKAPNTLYGGVAGYQPYVLTGGYFHHTADVEMDADGNAYWGTGIDTNGESTNTFFDLPSPSVGILSLAQLQHMQISTTSSSHLYGIGNGVADLKIGDTAVLFKDDDFEAEAPNAYLPVDQSFLINNALWDGFFFSGLSTDVDAADLSSWQAVPLNNRYQFAATATPAVINDPTSTSEALFVRGGFNINSTKKEAWKAILAGANTLNIDPADTGNSSILQSPISRSSFPSQASGDSNAERLNGFRELSDAELDSLADNIVEVIKTRGPFLSLSDFVNRRIETGNTTTGLYGTLEAAIQASDINDDRITTASGPLNEYTAANLPKWVTQPTDYITELFEGPRGEGISQWITQADLLQRIAPVISARTDTFIIRAYGESIDPISGEPVSSATCEATVQRVYEYTDDTGNTPDQAATVFNNATVTFEAGNLTALNQQFGRKYKIVSLKWL